MRVLSIFVVLAAFVALSAAQHGSSTNNRRNSALDRIVPRLLWNLRRGDNNQDSQKQVQPIIYYVQPPTSNSDSDKHHHHQHHEHPHYPYYPYYPPPPQTRPPQPQFPGMEYLGAGTGGGPTFLIVNPNNMQGIYLPSSGNSSNSTSARRSAYVPTLGDLLQGLNFNDLIDGSIFEDDSEVVDAAEEGMVQQGPALVNERPGGLTAAAAAATPEDDGDADLLSEDEIDALDRQNNRGLSPKHLLSLLMQDKRRKRIQEVLAGIYLRNTQLNRK